MGFIRTAGVWLGFVGDERGYYEDDDYDDEGFVVPPTRNTLRDHEPVRVPRRSGRRAGGNFWDEPFDAEDHGLGILHEPTPREQPRVRVDLRAVREEAEARLGERRVPTQAAPPLLRPAPPSAAGSTAMSVPAPEGLVPAPQVKLRERAAASDDRLARGGEITTLHPTGYGDARIVGERYRDGFPVLMDLTDLPESDAKRLVDFAAGLAFGLRGKIERVTNRVFLLTPRDMRIPEEEMRRLTDPGY
jgi:cell division inhibitor SepF